MKHFDNDMDELFNKAGQDYPLNTDRKNWDAVYKALHSEQSPLPPPSTPKYRRYLPLLLLLVIPAFYLADKINEDHRMDVTAKERGQDNREKEGNSEKQGKIGEREGLTGSKGEVARENGGVIREKEEAGEEKLEDIGKKEVVAGRKGDVITSKKGVVGQKADVITNKKGVVGQKGDVITSKKGVIGQKGDVNTNKEGLPAQKDEVIGKNKGVIEEKGEFIREARRANNKLFTIPNPSLPCDEINIPLNFDSVDAVTLSCAFPPVKIKQLKSRGFYYGLIGGPDISMIKFQEVRRPGSSVGLLLGYQLNPHWSVEASGLWSTKKYYTDGKHFDKTRSNIPDYVDILNLDGGCNMFEFPVAVRYLFTPGRNSFFATAGMTSWFMNNESYEYEGDAGGGVYEGYRSYKKSGNHLFANIQLTGGYEFKLFSKTNLRIEPYVQLPIKQVGIGKMPITSAGVHFGLMRNIR